MLKKFFFILGMLLLACPAAAEEITATCDKVLDGNTLVATANGKQYNVKLAYIIAPGLTQKFGAEAKQFVENLALNRKLRLLLISSRDNIKTAEVFSPLKQDPINRELVRKGLAWPVVDKNKRHPYDLSVSFAKKHSLGVWSDPTLQPPEQKAGSSDTKTSAPGSKQPQANYEPPAPAAGTQGGNFMMRQRQHINSKVSGNKDVQE